MNAYAAPRHGFAGVARLGCFMLGALALLVVVGPMLLLAGVVAAPVAIALGAAAIPLGLLLLVGVPAAIVGLPIALAALLCVGAVALVGTVLGGALSLAWALLKLLVFFVLPVAFVGWLCWVVFRWIFA